MRNQETFLDRSTIIALVSLLFVWFAWSSYMKKKYPPKKQEAVKVAPSIKGESSPEDTWQLPQVKKPKETILNHSGKNLKLEISSLGMGIKKGTLLSFSDQEEKLIVFTSKQDPLFATRALESNETILFDMKKTTTGFVGWHKSPLLTLKKSISIQDDKYFLSVKTEILKQEKNFEGLSIHWLADFETKKEEKRAWYLKMFFFSLPSALTGFTVFEEGTERSLAEDFDSQKEYKNVSFAGLGIKYFGQAFINKGALLPSLRFKGGENFLEGRIFYNTRSLKEKEISYSLFLGPKSIEYLKPLHAKAQNWIDYGIFDWLARPLLSFLKFLQSLVQNWGFAIILLTFFIRLLLLPINIKSYKSMRAMQKLQGPIQELKKQYKDSPKELNQRMLALMKEHKANPLGGCLPLFLQFPVFFALYRVLGESLELYKAPFIFWIGDLSTKDPFFVLPFASGIVLFAQQKLTPMNVPKAQARLLTFMPLVFSFFMLGLPSGLTLYIFVSGLFGFVQQAVFVKLRGDSKGGTHVKSIR